MIYVDPLFKVHPNQVKDKQAKRLTAKYGSWCHMVADNTEELLRFGARMGLKLAWVQKLGTPEEHFDLVPTRRVTALNRGAKEITREQMMQLIQAKRDGQPIPNFDSPTQPEPAQVELFSHRNHPV